MRKLPVASGREGIKQKRPINDNARQSALSITQFSDRAGVLAIIVNRQQLMTYASC